MGDDDHEITRLLKGWEEGSAGAEDRLMTRVYRELRKVAAAYMRRERRDNTLQTTAVVNEAYLRLSAQRSTRWQNRSHFFGIAAQFMRRILVDHARRRRAAKRTTDAPPLIGLERPAQEPALDPVDVLTLHTALEALAKVDTRQAAIVEARYFAGMTVEETADLLRMSPATVKREWSAAIAWLRAHLESPP